MSKVCVKVRGSEKDERGNMSDSEKAVIQKFRKRDVTHIGSTQVEGKRNLIA